MKKFMDKDFLLSTETAQRLYHEYAADMPIIDYHCHVIPREIAEDRHFENITQVWLGGDHYKWRLMRSNGVDEKYITGDASDREKFQKFAETLPRAIGNPMYHWCHLELKTYFGYEGVLNADTAETVWNLAKEVLSKKEMGVRGIIGMSNVAFIGTTDDPADSLEWHVQLQADPDMKTKVAPSYRPDKALNIEKDGFLEYVNRLSGVCGFEIKNPADMKKALSSRLEFFASLGCRASDHALDRTDFVLMSDEEVETVMAKAFRGEKLTVDEADGYRCYMLMHCAKEYVRLGIVMQLHYNCIRNTNTIMYNKLGPDTGFDCVGPYNGARGLVKLLDTLNLNGALPRTVLYSLDGGENAFIDSVIGAFQGSEIGGKIQHGSAWWFNDTKQGMIDQMVSLANLSILGNFIGMLTDSRSFLSYTRHEYFRRILCELIGGWIENGEYPDDIEAAGALVRDICYNNAAKYFRLV